MKKIFALQIAMLLVFTGSLGALFLYTDVYDEVQRKIVEELCLSCVKLKVNTKFEWRTQTANNADNPSFVIENLSKGPVILVYRIGFCPGCDRLEENVLFQVFNFTFEKDDVFYKQFEFEQGNITFVHINTDELDHESPLYKSRAIYDIVGDRGNPMVTLVTYTYCQGFVKTSFATIYSLNAESYEEQQEELRGFINEAISLYNRHKKAAD
jgi:hypothetical protein